MVHAVGTAEYDMKNSKEYSTKIKKLYRSLKAKYPKVKKAFYDEPAEALVYAIISENMSEQATESAIKKFADYFVDLNDLRVSRTEEIVEVLGEDIQISKDTASTITKALRNIYEAYNSVSLMGLKKIGKRPARQILEKMDSISRFATNYCLLASLQSHTIPLTKNMIEYLRKNELVHPDADEQEIEGFLAKQISAANTYEFYALLRTSAESKKGRKKTKTASKTKKKASKAAKKKK
jgi:endonuclease III